MAARKLTPEFLEAMDRVVKRLSPQYQNQVKDKVTLKKSGDLKSSIEVRNFRRAADKWRLGLYMKRYGYILHNQAANKKYKKTRSVPLPANGKIMSNIKAYQNTVDTFLSLEDNLIKELEGEMAENIEDSMVNNLIEAFKNT